MQGNNYEINNNNVVVVASGVHQACAACKHQRKKCTNECILAPFFPAEKSSEFKAAHKVFGLSNISKLIKDLDTFELRKKATDAIIWDAKAWQKNSVEGSYGEYKRIQQENTELKNIINVRTAQSNLMYNQGFVAYMNNGIISNGGEVIDNYGQQNNGNMIAAYGYGPCGQAYPKGNLVRDNVNAVNQIHPRNVLNAHAQYFLPDQQFNQMNPAMEEPMWKRAP
ncbi:hypothetical protein GIB67_039276 [Kingdonia uniflora]|uniref:LOB domain-containing protein n=1 Tax=Kingdonia uniflora TaxID=39325 RepID=A0A7J7MLY6_9MAGN|nr:hypothetical protein GIB67_039276 [Kingdonia uniflora]